MKASMLAIALSCASAGLQAEEVTIGVHHFMSQKAPPHAKFLLPLAESVAKASDGHIKIEPYAGMSLGGRPGDLYDQAVDDAVEAALTLPGYSAERFKRSEVLELPFLMQNSVATSKAFYSD